MEKWETGPVGPPPVERRPSVGSAVFSSRPWDDEADGDAAYPEEVEGVPVREYLRTRRDVRGALVSLADGRYALTGSTLAIGGTKQVQAYARRRLVRETRRHREGLVAGGDRRSRTLTPAPLASIRTRAYSRARRSERETFSARCTDSSTRRTPQWRMRLCDRDEEKLAELGYKQELNRGWSQFANFAISFSIISVLAGCFTIYGQAWNFGGPVAISSAGR